MTNLGITRRIDELGRIVIPKEIRRNLRIKDNEPLEVNISDNKIILSKCELLEKDKVINMLLFSLKKYLQKNVLYTSRNKVVDYSLIDKNIVINNELSNSFINIIESRQEKVINNDKSLLKSDNFLSYYFCPLIVNGDLYGSIIVYSSDEINLKDEIIIKYLKNFLELYLE